MGVSKTVTVTCDYSGCRENSGHPQVLIWNETDVEHGKIQPPELAKYLVLLTHNQTLKSFCCQLHASMYFLPPGYESTQKKIIDFPPKNPPMIEQGDGVREDDPVNGQGQNCNHDWDVHSKFGCREEKCECNLSPEESK